MFSYQMDSVKADETVDRPATPPIRFEDIPGLNIRPEQTTVDTVLGKRRTIKTITTIEIAFIVIAVIGILSTIGLTITVIVNEVKDANTSSDLIFAIVLLINALFCLYYICDGVLFESAYEIVVFVGATTILLIYCIISFSQDKEDVIKTVRFYMIIVLGPFCVVLGSLLAKSYYESKNIIFRTVGASVELQDMCGLMLFFQTLLKFDLQLEVSMVVFVLSDATDNITTDIIVLSVGVVYSLVWVALGFFSVRYESKKLVILFFLTSIAEPAYIIYKVIDVWVIADEEDLIKSAIITCGIIGLIIRIVVCITMYFVTKNFGNGLKEKVYGQSSGDTAAVIGNESQVPPQGV